METKPNRFLQIATLAFALSMLTTYMVYSQLQRTRYVAASPSPATNQFKGPHPPAVLHKTNELRRQLVVAPSSKVRAPLLEMPTPASKPTAPTGPRSKMIASGSKSAAVFDFRPQQQAQEPPASHSTMVAPGSKSAAVFDLRQQPQAQAPKAVVAAPSSRQTTNHTVTLPH